ncbi:hypothetical protein M569_15837, partial [Genlisea aurea]
MKALYVFTRPYALIGTGMAVVSHSLLAVQSFQDISMPFLVGLVQVWIVFALVQIFASGINQIYDVEIDKINKPHLPVASGAISKQFAATIVTAAAILSLGLPIMLRSVPLVSGGVICFLLGCAYSMELPFMRWKSNQTLTTMVIGLGRGLLFPFITFFHFQSSVLGRPIVLTKSLLFSTCVCSLIATVISLAKVI